MADPNFLSFVRNPFGLGSAGGLANVGSKAAPTFADINNDGVLDAFVGNDSGDILFFQNTGTASSPMFAAPQTNPFGLANVGSSAAPTFADINNDGVLDAFVGNDSGDILFFQNTGTASSPMFAAPQTNPFGLANVGSSAAPTFADINNDGVLDAFVGNDSGDILFFQNTGTASSPMFAAPQTNPFGLANVGSKAAPTFADINNDGVLDAFVGNDSGDILFFQNTGTASSPMFAAPQTNPFGLANVSPVIPDVNLSGFAAPTLADINNDGNLDAFVGNNSGNIVFFKNGINEANSEFTVSNLNGTNGFAINPINQFDFSNSSVSAAGDINGDGFDDIIIGVPSTGQSYVVFGGANVASDGTFNLSSLNGTNGFTINDGSGKSVSVAGDINGDGFDDIIIGAPDASPNGIVRAGQSYVIFGGANVGSDGTFNLSSLNGTNGFTLNGIAFNDNSGTSVSAAGDINGDGFDDIIIGAPNADPNGILNAGQSYIDSGNLNVGQSYVVFGGPTVGEGGTINLSSLNGTNGFTLNGIAFNDNSGTSVSAAGDINGDGFDDIIIGAPNASPGILNAGQSYVVFGGPTVGKDGTINLSSLDGTNGFALNGIAFNDNSGTSVSGAGDINGDGFDDIIIGAPSSNTSFDLVNRTGQSYVVFGGPTVGEGGTINLSSLDGTNGFTLNGIAGLDLSGTSVSSAGDINNDGFDDIIIGAPYANPKFIVDAGQSYVVFGSPTVGSGGTINLSSLDSTNGFTLDGIASGNSLGTSVSDAGDINGDGIDDLIIASSSAIYVVFGGATVGSGGT